MREDVIYATSDVARDILQNADYFTSVGKAVTEYVWNSIDYCKPGARVEVHIDRRKGKISVRKRRAVRFNGILIRETRNGGGMSREDLQRFFTMHAETLARKEGRQVRGRFGTGKSAAFGIGKTLIVDTVKDGKRNVVRLNIENLRPGLDKVPIESLLINQDVTASDGTMVIIDRLKLRRVKMESAKKFLRRSLGLHLRNHDIYVGEEKLEYFQPGHERIWRFECPADLLPYLGPCRLELKLAKEELEEEERGVAILSGSYPMEFFGLDKFGPWSRRLFGEIDVPLLDSPDTIPAFDNTRSRLNRDNERVSRLLSWIEDRVTGIVAELENEAKAKLGQEQVKRLEETARELENILNEDLSEIVDELETTPDIGGSGDVASGVQRKESGVGTLILDEEGKEVVAPDPEGDLITLRSEATAAGPVSPEPHEPERRRRSDDGDKAADILTSGSKRKPRGGFRITYTHDGPEAPRASFVSEKMEIRINLDHPELALFPEPGDTRFKALSAEIAISECAIALVNLKLQYGHVDVSNTGYDALIEYRRTLNRLGRKLAPLISRWLAA